MDYSLVDVLVDFSNLPKHKQQVGKLVSIADQIVTLIGAKPLRSDSTVNFRLYGGWFSGALLNAPAQQIAADLRAAFPKYFYLARHLAIRVQAELALSLIAEPGTDLPHTYRQKAWPSGIKCAMPNAHGCSSLACPIRALPDLLETGYCTEPTCPVTAEAILTRDEQKLVDTMLTADAIHLAYRGDPSIGILSSDEDFWPAMRSATIRGSTVFHFHAKSGMDTKREYVQGLGRKYVSHTL